MRRDTQIRNAVSGFLKKYGEPSENDIYELAFFWRTTDVYIKHIFEEIKRKLYK